MQVQLDYVTPLLQRLERNLGGLNVLQPVTTYKNPSRTRVANKKPRAQHEVWSTTGLKPNYLSQKIHVGLFPLYCKQDIFIFYIQWLIFLLIGNTMKNTMLRKGLTIF